MSRPAVMVGGPPRWWLQPRIALPVLAIVIAGAAVLTPRERSARDGDGRLSTFSPLPLGAQLLHDLARRLGWDVTRRTEPGLPRDSSAILALLDPPIVPTAVQAGAIMRHVRGGGALLYVMTRDGALNDSLGVTQGDGNPAAIPDAIHGSVPADCANGSDGAMPLWAGADMHLWAIRWRRPPPASIVVFADTERDAEFPGPVRDSMARRPRNRPPAAAGFPLGAGRVVVVADPDLLRNDVLRVCRWGAAVAAVRMLEYLSVGRPRQLVFDEYAQRHGDHPGTFGVIAKFFARTPEGHMLAGLLLAGFVWLLARAPRLLPPRHSSHVERRSPAEHVQALARAYENVGATRTAIYRLLHGLRRRVARQGAPPLADDAAAAFLEWAGRRAPGASDDIALLTRAVQQSISARELVLAGQALRRLELALTHPRPAHPDRVATPASTSATP